MQVDSLPNEPFPSLNPRLVNVVEDSGVLNLGSL